MNQYFYNREHLFVSPSISDSMKTSAYYNANRNMAYQDESRMAELVGKVLYTNNCSRYNTLTHLF
jgi:hypothetical protein